jgi:hypothetical protein
MHESKGMTVFAQVGGARSNILLIACSLSSTNQNLQNRHSRCKLPPFYYLPGSAGVLTKQHGTTINKTALATTKNVFLTDR